MFIDSQTTRPRPFSYDRAMRRQGVLVPNAPKWWLFAHLLIAGACLAIAALAPKDGEPLLLVPLTDRAAADIPLLALRHGVRLVGRGPIGRSLIVIEDENTPAWLTLIKAGIIPVGSRGRLCGDGFTLQGNPA